MHLTERYGNVFAIVFAVIWLGVAGVLYSHAYRLQMDYYAQFPDEIHFDESNPNMPSSLGSNKAMWRVLLREQLDPTVEGMRRDIWRQLRLYAIWIFEFPISVFTRGS